MIHSTYIHYTFEILRSENISHSMRPNGYCDVWMAFPMVVCGIPLLRRSSVPGFPRFLPDVRPFPSFAVRSAFDGAFRPI